jgi:hypothetical protein
MSDMSSTPGFSLKAALSESLRYAVPGIGHVFKITWPVLLAFIATLVVLSVLFSAIFGFGEIVQRRPYSTGRFVFDIINFMVSLSFGTALLVIITRDYLLQESPVRLFSTFWPVMLRYLLLMLIFVVGFIVFIIVVVFAGILLGAALGPTAVDIISIPFMLLSVVGFGYLFCRIISWVTSCAVGYPQTLRQAWRATAGATAWKILGGLVLIVLITAAALLAFVLLSAFMIYAVDKISIVGAIPFAIVLFVALTVVYMMFIALITVYPANIFKQTAA